MAVTAKWMWAEPRTTFFGERSAQFNPMRWSKWQGIEATIKELETCLFDDGERAVLIALSTGRRRRYDDVARAIARIGGHRRAGVQDWVLVKDTDGVGQTWLYTPDLVESKRRNLGNISEDADDLNESGVLRDAFDKGGYEVVFDASKSRTSSCSSLRTSHSRTSLVSQRTTRSHRPSHRLGR